MFNSLWSRPKKLALNSKSRICRISEKEDNLVGYTQFPGKFCSIRFSPRNFQNFRFNGSLLEISTISRFSGIFSPEISEPLFRKYGSNGKGPRTTLWGDLNFRKFLTTNYRYKVAFPPQWNFGLNDSLCGFRFSSGFFGKRSQEISLPFAPISKFSEFEVGWKTLLLLEIPNTEVRQVQK